MESQWLNHISAIEVRGGNEERQNSRVMLSVSLRDVLIVLAGRGRSRHGEVPESMQLYQFGICLSVETEGGAGL